ncbi:MAG: hypothetical protein Ct9H300mP7_1100 [Verrucomicrobiota bacterium]|nr:MAG: hypothetical protein Ct9H300mP7_1100 [Verrucomicrobiota bacterium]
MREVDLSFFGEIYIMKFEVGANPPDPHARLRRRPVFFSGWFEDCLAALQQVRAGAGIHTMKPDGSDIRKITNFKSMSWGTVFFIRPVTTLFLPATSLASPILNCTSSIRLWAQNQPVRSPNAPASMACRVFSPEAPDSAGLKRHAGKKVAALPRQLGSPGALAALAKPGKALPPNRTVTRRLDRNPKKHVAYLASDELEGRRTGSKGIRKGPPTTFASTQKNRASTQIWIRAG